MKLSIAIPTFNRGKLALEKVQFILNNLEKSEDWEIVVSDNCSDKQSEFYEDIKNLSKYNRNLKYIKRASNGGLLGNFIEIIERSKGDWLAIYSDEDFPNVNFLDKIKNYSVNNGIGIVRAGVTGGKGNSFECEDLLVAKGIDAINSCGYHFNYISGVVYNLNQIKERRLLDDYKKISWAHYDYPHLLMDTLLCAQMDVLMSSDFSALEGDEEIVDYSNNSNVYKLPYSIGARTDQFWSTWKSILFALEISRSSLKNAEYGYLYINLCLRFSNLITVNFPLYAQNGFDLRMVVATYIDFMKSLAPRDYGDDVYLYLISSLEILYAQKLVQVATSQVKE